jgi:hypothetical protein
LNDKIRKLNADKKAISEMATKHGLIDAPRISQFSYLTVPGRGGRESPGAANYGSIISTQDPKDRVKEYHKQVAARRKVISEKNAKKEI